MKFYYRLSVAFFIVLLQACNYNEEFVLAGEKISITVPMGLDAKVVKDDDGSEVLYLYEQNNEVMWVYQLFYEDEVPKGLKQQKKWLEEEGVVLVSEGEEWEHGFGVTFKDVEGLDFEYYLQINGKWFFAAPMFYDYDKLSALQAALKSIEPI